jgi:hypothetical protein
MAQCPGPERCCSMVWRRRALLVYGPPGCEGVDPVPGSQARQLCDLASATQGPHGGSRALRTALHQWVPGCGRVGPMPGARAILLQGVATKRRCSQERATHQCSTDDERDDGDRRRNCADGGSTSGFGVGGPAGSQAPGPVRRPSGRALRPCCCTAVAARCVRRRQRRTSAGYPKDLASIRATACTTSQQPTQKDAESRDPDEGRHHGQPGFEGVGPVPGAQARQVHDLPRRAANMSAQRDDPPRRAANLGAQLDDSPRRAANTGAQRDDPLRRAVNMGAQRDDPPRRAAHLGAHRDDPPRRATNKGAHVADQPRRAAHLGTQNDHPPPRAANMGALQIALLRGLPGCMGEGPVPGARRRNLQARASAYTRAMCTKGHAIR